MFSWKDILHTLTRREDVAPPALQWVMDEIMEGRAGEVEIAAFLMGLRVKGETPAEIATAVGVLRKHMVGWDPGRPDVLDTCGTGGDGSATFNVSTATALVVAGVGAAVVKHGNRAVSSRSGSADVLAALGVPIEGDAAFARKSLEATGFAFCFAPRFHPSMRHVAAVRQRLGVPTIFNCLGPLANPAGARRQLMGVGRRELLDLMAQSLSRLGVDRALVVHGADGMDEISLAGPTLVREVAGDKVTAWEWTPGDFGLPAVSAAQVKVADAQASAAVIVEVLKGVEGPALHLVLANAAAALWAARDVRDVRQGVAAARAAIQSGAAAGVLERLRALT